MEELRLVGCDEGGARFGQTNGPTFRRQFPTFAFACYCKLNSPIPFAFACWRLSLAYSCWELIVFCYYGELLLPTVKFCIACITFFFFLGMPGITPNNFELCSEQSP